MCEDLTILTENLPPLNFVDNDVLVGPSVEIVQAIQKKIGSNEPIQVYPWSRAYKMAEKEKKIEIEITEKATSYYFDLKYFAKVPSIYHKSITEV